MSYTPIDKYGNIRIILYIQQPPHTPTTGPAARPPAAHRASVNRKRRNSKERAEMNQSEEEQARPRMQERINTIDA